ncbi:5'/3'-nucleotidase SurE [Psychrobacter sp. P2G3]|uniref:5'/3'-nucleotidase SurE n=1 Tax=Psychrobacter sp. P2G3 TaxID=1699622 RepID=UPI00078CCACB|nr:5'/3'-nucleotidase SurE [Psychrobacter sp. P2G3]AMN49278.1 5'-nucleotidase [Psychrobacter sp. P2G3]
MKFLISNDDGIHAPGLLALYQALSKVGEVMVVAPNAEESGSASSLHISQPLYTHELPSGFIAVNGSPADCVYLALHQLYSDIQFDCVITGINSGDNLGQKVFFSGTFGAALTAQLFGVPAIATSLVGGKIKGNGEDKISHYQMAAEEIVKLLTETPILEEITRLPYHVLNVNIPNVDTAEAINGRKVTTLEHSLLANPVHQIVDPRGRDAYWLCLKNCQNPKTEEYSGASIDTFNDDPINGYKPLGINSLELKNQSITDNNDSVVVYTDAQAVAAGYISLSPVRLHHTPTYALDRLSTLAL